MSDIVKRKVRETWREAVARRLSEGRPGDQAAGLGEFDAAVGEGRGEAEAAYAVLSARHLLWSVDAPGFTGAARDPDGPHSVPSA